MTTNETSDNPVALITGAAQRLGANTARHLHANGFKVALHYRTSAAPANALAAELNKIRPQSAHTFAADLLDSAAPDALIRDVINECGQLNALVNNASSFYATALGDITDEVWNDLIGTNLKAPLFLIQAAAPHLRRSRGCVVNMLDIYTERPPALHAVYCAAKGGMAVLTRALALELAPHVRVNGIAPGAILWPHPEPTEEAKNAIIKSVPLERLGDRQDIAKAALYLIRDAHYTTGETIAVDGGRRLRI